MECKTLGEFKKRLQKAIDSRDMKEFGELLHSCPFPSFYKCNKWCPNCPLSDAEGPRELIGQAETCLIDAMLETCQDYYFDHTIGKDNTLAGLVLMSIKLLAYLENRT